LYAVDFSQQLLKFFSLGRVLKLTITNPDGSLELYTCVLQRLAPPYWSPAVPGPREAGNESNQLVVTGFL